MLKVKAIRDESPDRRVFEIHDEGEPAPVERLAQVVRVAERLIQENELPGTYSSDADGVLALTLAAPGRSFFHDGIVFASLDAVNDPVKNPTLTRLDFEIPPESGRETPR